MRMEWIRGFRFSAVAAGVKKAGSDRLDLGLIVADRPAVTAGVTTTNLVFAAPVAITRERLAGGICQAILANSGNANAYTGRQGIEDAAALCREAGMNLDIDPALIIPLSTGVIGKPMPVERMALRIPDLVKNLAPGRFMDFANAIITTDTKAKTAALDAELSTGVIRLLGVAKGAGMIAPNMATMLAVVMIDANVEPAFLRECITQAADETFNCIAIDNDMSTNDTLIAMAGARPEAPQVGPAEADRDAFAAALTETCRGLARQIVLDGEGATKLVEIRVRGAADNKSASKIARAIAESQLVKTAFCGQDPNWGRIVAAAGRGGAAFDPGQLDLFIGDVPIVRRGEIAGDDWEPRAKAVMMERDFAVTLDLGRGEGKAVFLTCDLSEEYVRINADYRT